MKNHVFIFCCLLLISWQCSRPSSNKAEPGISGSQLPKALIITTGLSEDNTQMAPGIVVAIQSLNKLGVPVRLEPRDVLFDYKTLSAFNILILSTFPGYHDADRKYSLSYMSDEELYNIARFVENGGVLVSGDNVGRNYSDGTDRIIVFRELTPDNWPLSACFGISLSEVNVTGYRLEGDIRDYLQWDVSKDFLSTGENEIWTLVADSMFSKHLKVHGCWKRGTDSLATMLENNYGKGKSYLLPLSGLLHPSNDGGFWSEEQISRFYSYVIDNYNKGYDLRVSLNPWPSGHDFAFCVSLNAEGNKEQYKRVFKMLEEKKVIPSIFVNGSVAKDIKEMLDASGFPLASSGYSYINHAEIQYPQAVEDILRNENSWDRDFSGFRFPFTKPSNWSILALCEFDYKYESSIGADNLDFFHGSVVPYNLVVTSNGFYRRTDILEIAPSYHDDYYFLNAIKNEKLPDSNFLQKNISIYRKYLGNYWQYAVRPYHGLMVYLGHPAYVGYNDSTLTALSGLIDQVKDDNTWVTTLDAAAEFRKGLESVNVYFDPGNRQVAVIAPENLLLQEVCLNFQEKISSAAAITGNARVENVGEGSRLIFDAFNGQTVKLAFERSTD
jgi:peptidoglycan/xylan/chitin deacetylase (PgdA/CDA1 family)